MDKLFILLQEIAPQHFLSFLAGKLAKVENITIKNFLIKHFTNIFKVNLSEAEFEDINSYKNFSDFFTRPLKKGAREIANSAFVSPVDGRISQFGKIKEGKIIQAKGMYFTVNEIIANETKDYENGSFATIYLSPKDYHRIHMPVNATLTKYIYVPGDKYSVNQITAQNVPNLFARNERVVFFFDTEFGKMVLVLVGAMIVGSVQTPFAGIVAPNTRKINEFNLIENKAISFKKGEELGRFLLGSTVVALFEKDLPFTENVQIDASVKMGESFIDTQKELI